MTVSPGKTGSETRPLRLFLDTGVIIEGCFGSWGAAKAVLILATIRVNWIVVLAEAIVKGEVPEVPGLPESFNVLVRELQSLCLDVELLKE